MEIMYEVPKGSTDIILHENVRRCRGNVFIHEEDDGLHFVRVSKEHSFDADFFPTEEEAINFIRSDLSKKAAKAEKEAELYRQTIREFEECL